MRAYPQVAIKEDGFVLPREILSECKNLGISAYRQKDVSEAVRLLTRAEEHDKADHEIPYFLGLSFLAEHDYESARGAFSRSLTKNPEYNLAREKLVFCCCKLGGAHEAFELMKEQMHDLLFLHPPVMKKKEKGMISILVPAFNESNKILRNLKEIKHTVAAQGYDFEIIVVDDGSEDDTFEIVDMISRTVKEVRAYRSDTNKGKGAALREAALKSKGDVIVFLDADLELHPRLIARLLEHMERENADVVLGSKRHPLSRLNYPWHRQVMSRTYYLLNNILFGLPVKDTQTGIKIFKRECLLSILPKLLEKRYAFDLELIVNIHASGYKIVEAPIDIEYSRKFSRIGLTAIVVTIIDTLAIYYRLKILHYYDREIPPLLTTPTVSIVIAFKAFNDFARQSLNCCRRLDYPDFEIILLPDEAVELTLPRVKVIPTGPIPPSEKREIGVRESTGQIIAFLDDDAYPDRNWLRNVVRNFNDPEISAVGGPGITPPDEGFWRRLSGSIYSSYLVSGQYTYRYVPRTYKEVQDFPTCNFSIRKKDFDRIGGFGTRYWPGEDTMLCLKIVKQLKKRIIYDPDAVVYHHRRSLLNGHLKQIKEYALHRGFFVKRFPETSRKLSYFAPSLFVIGLFSGMLFSLMNPTFSTIYWAMFIFYSFLIALPFVLSCHPKWVFFGMLGIFVTHVTYGLYFMKGLLTSRLEK
jgi:glycosyltransferase involved in cell wall biosynthesis